MTRGDTLGHSASEIRASEGEGDEGSIKGDGVERNQMTAQGERVEGTRKEYHSHSDVGRCCEARAQ